MAKPKANATAKPFNHEGHEVREGTDRLQVTGDRLQQKERGKNAASRQGRDADGFNYPLTKLPIYPIALLPTYAIP
jgi:hypothetical protein